MYLTETGKIIRKVRHESKHNMARKLKKFNKLLGDGRITMTQIDQSYQSWKGHARNGNCYHLIKNMDTLYNQLFKEGEKLNGTKHLESADRSKN